MEKMKVEARFHWLQGIKCLEIIHVDFLFKKYDLKGRQEMKGSPQGHKIEKKMFLYKYILR